MVDVLSKEKIHEQISLTNNYNLYNAIKNPSLNMFAFGRLLTRIFSPASARASGANKKGATGIEAAAHITKTAAEVQDGTPNVDDDDDDDNVGLGYDRIVGIDGSQDEVSPYEIELRQLTGGPEDEEDGDDDDQNSDEDQNEEDGEKAKKTKPRKRNPLLERLVPPNFGSKSNLNDREQVLLKVSYLHDILQSITLNLTTYLYKGIK